MKDAHIVSALRTKRLEVSALVADTEKKLAKLRANLANLDAAIDILTPGHPDAPPPRRPCRRTRYFAVNELPRFALDMLRKAAKPLSAAEIAAAAVASKGLPSSAVTAVTEMVFLILRTQTKRGVLVRTGGFRNGKWAIA